MEKEYLSVKEYADLCELSQQAVYKQLDGKLKDYFKLIDGKKMIHRSAVEIGKTGNYTFQQVEQLVEQQLNNQLNNQLKQENEDLKFQIEQLKILQKEEIERLKDIYQSQIDDLKKDKENYNQLLNQQQQLNAMAQKKILLLEDQANQKWWQKLFIKKGDIQNDERTN